jgi:hypothetical protein
METAVECGQRGQQQAEGEDSFDEDPGRVPGPIVIKVPYVFDAECHVPDQVEGANPREPLRDMPLIRE